MSGRDRVALVTGAAGGLGRALVAALGDAGWVVVGATHSDGPYGADLSRADEARDLVARVIAGRGRLDLLVANHAAMTMAPVFEHPVDDWWRVVDTNLGGSFHLARAAAPHLREAAGAIVFISSEWGITGWPRASAYASSKAGLIGLTKALARELAPRVRVNALAPGIINTPQLGVDAQDAGLTLGEMKGRYEEATPLNRIASPEEIAATVVFLASQAGSFYTGQVLQPNGGATMAS
ncbi:MAG: SDR family oxidoreductase [Chloroflexi bacterium]|nr:MAG: SDR family oxidoreductase [Chloroflexota bacterium]